MTLEATAWALFERHRNGTAPLSLKAGSFVGQVAVCPDWPLSDRQRAWLGKLIERAGLPPIEEVAHVG